MNWCACTGACQCAACARSWNFNTCVAGAVRLRDTSQSVRRRAGALVALGEILAAFGGSAEPWTIGLLGPVLDCVGHKAADVRALAASVATRMFELLSDQAVRLVLPAVFEGLKHDKEEVKLLVLGQIAAMADSSKRQPLALELYEIVPLA